MSHGRFGDTLPPRWLEALALPIEKIDSSHLAALPVEARLLATAYIHLWPAGLTLGPDDLCELPGLVEFLNLSRVQLIAALDVFGVLLLASSVRQMINGHQLRAVYQQLGTANRKWLDSADRIDLIAASNLATSPAGQPLRLADLREDAVLEWNSIRHLGADTAVVVAASWLWRRLGALRPAIWALIRLRISSAVLIEAESGKLRFGSNEPGAEGLGDSELESGRSAPDSRRRCLDPKQEVVFFFALIKLLGTEIHDLG